MSKREFYQAAKFLKQEQQRKTSKRTVKRLRGKENRRPIRGNKKRMKWHISMYTLFIIVGV